jgi:hypothetical protein
MLRSIIGVKATYPHDHDPASASCCRISRRSRLFVRHLAQSRRACVRCRGLHDLAHRRSYGMSGRGIAADTVRRNTPQGLYTRLQSHASGRRSGDQFCVYVADGLVLPSLSPEDIGQATTKWMLLCVGTSTKTSTIALFWCLTDRRHPRLKRRSSAVSGSMVVRYSIPEAEIMTRSFRQPLPFRKTDNSCGCSKSGRACAEVRSREPLADEPCV